MNERPRIIAELIERLSELPGVGRKTAERYVYYLIQQPQEKIERLGQTISQLSTAITTCSVCHRIADSSPCSICTNDKRNPKMLCVVAESQDIAPVENTGHFTGRYHVLGGVINTLDGVGPDQLQIDSLLNRVTDQGITEVLLALNPDIEGESTALHLTRLLKEKKVKVTRLARGLPMGSELAYADEITLASAIDGRQEI